MKKISARFILIIAAFLFSVVGSRADASTYAQILKDRDVVLSKILASREAGLATGINNEEAVSDAQLALYSFRRDVSSDSAERLKNQELIIKTWEKKLAALKAKSGVGLGGDIDFLLATDRVLQAKQTFEELKKN